MLKDYKYIIIIAISLMLIVLAITFNDKSQEPKPSKKIVSLSTFTLYDIAKHIAGDTLELVKIIPSGVDIHAYEPTPKTMVKVEKSNLLIYSGAGLEPWLSSFNFNGKTIEIANYIRLKHLSEDEHEDHEHESHEHSGHSCSHSSYDPHFWLDVKNMEEAANLMMYEFIRLVPKNKLLYIENRDKYIKMLKRIDNLYKEKLNSCSLDTIVTNHNAFSYLSDKYDFHVSSLKGLSPDSEPSPKDMIRIIETIKKHKTPVVFFEDFSSSKSMASLAQQANVKMDSLHTLGNITKSDVEMKYTYEDIMLNNLEKLSEALVCQ